LCARSIERWRRLLWGVYNRPALVIMPPARMG
jgi:hypothetical protein